MVKREFRHLLLTCALGSTAASAAPFQPVWQLGSDDNASEPFGSENYSPNNAPGSASVRDDDYYLKGLYPLPIGNLTANEPLGNFERAITSGDPRDRIHFPLTAAQAASTARLRVTVDFYGGGGSTAKGFNRHDVAVKFNGVLIATRTAISWDNTLTITVPATTVNAVAAVDGIASENVLQIERTGGTSSAWLQLDYVKLEVDPSGGTDADGDGMPRWYEETYGLSDSNPADISGDPDGDGLSYLQEYQKGTNPTAPDTDSDGLKDGAEIATNPLNPDTDGDGLLDGAETTSSPILADTDSDGYPDNIELEQGTNPQSAASKPFNFPGAVGFQFISESRSNVALKAGEPAGYFRLPNWNSSIPQARWVTPPISGSATALKNHRAEATTVGVSWSSYASAEGFHRGVSDENLLSGMIYAGTSGTTPYPATVNLTGISYPTYDIIVYIGNIYPETRGYVERATDSGSRRYFRSASGPPFRGWIEATATTLTTSPPLANYVRFRNLTGATQSFSTFHVDANNNVAIHGFQIVNTSVDTDGDGLKDVAEVEYKLNPSVPDATADADGDILTNADEITLGTDPHKRDTDNDGLADNLEAANGGNPLNPDTDGDGLTDGNEVLASPFPSLANNPDSDGDGANDAAERAAGSNPMLAASKPPGVPVWENGNTWRWKVQPVRLLWNHEQSMLGAIPGDETMVWESIVNRAGTDWNGRIAIGLRWRNGRLTYRFYCGPQTFYTNGNSANGFWASDWNTFPTDISAQVGFSGFGTADDSVPLGIEFAATHTGGNIWTLNFKLLNVTNTGAPVTIASWSPTNAVGGDPSLQAGTTTWTTVNGVAGVSTTETEAGVDAYFTTTPLGPADSDSDGMPDTWETANTLLPGNAADAIQDPDGDGLTNRDEWRAGTNPRDADSDDDGASDGVEVAQGSNPLSAASLPRAFTFTGSAQDVDGDGLSDAWSLWSGGKSRVASADDDGDGVSNYAESVAGTNPDDASSRLTFDSTPEGSNLRLIWPNLPYKSHVVQTSTTLGGWATATGLSAPVITNGNREVVATGVLAPGGAASRFYRATVSPLDTDGDGVEDWTEVNVLGSSITVANSLGQAIVLQNGQTLSGDALALQQRMSGSPPSPGGPTGNSIPAAPTPVQASRFLMQATFGPVPEDIETVRQLGYEGWINAQLQIAPTYLQPYIREIKADAYGPRADKTYNFNELDKFIHGNNVTTPFARAAIAGPDQLRQRIAFALSQILVASRRDAQLEEKAEAMAYYYDVFVRNALGNYRDVLMDITFNPAMGWYLSHAGNQKGDPSIPRYPDENYAREVMQLFSIGLWELNPDGSRKLDVHGEPIPTYGNAEITEMARVFTGLYFDAPYGWNGGGWADEHYTKPMVMYPQYHDFGTKTLLKGFVIPASEETAENGVADVRNAIDALFRHPNTPPFICRQLIQFLVTDNPTPAYIRRVQDVFVNDGQGVRGNLTAVAKAILLDPEARQQPISPSFGKEREPVIRTMHLGRLFKLAQTHPKFVWWNWTENYYGASVQEPMNSPSVFNFYTPSYQAPGEIRNSGLVSPVMQIVNTYSAVSFPNLLLEYLHSGFRSAYNWWYPLDYGETLLVASKPQALVDQVDLLICAGNMTARTRSILLEKLADTALSETDRVTLAVWLAMTCPEGAVQR